MESLLCYEPMDIVYTWVNGNDSRLLSDIDAFKREHERKEHLAKDPNWTQPVGIGLKLVLNGGTPRKWKNELFDGIREELALQIERIVSDHRELVVHRPNHTLPAITNETLDGHGNETEGAVNGSIAHIVANIEALDELMDDDSDHDGNDIDDEGYGQGEGAEDVDALS